MPAVLCSGGLDSTVLLAEELVRAGAALPIHVRAGLAWEDAEARALARLLASPPFAGRARPLLETGEGDGHPQLGGQRPEVPDV